MKVYSILYLFVLLLFAIHDTSGLTKPRHDKVVACYVVSWAWYRPSPGKFGIKNLRGDLCTHIIYAFAGINATDWTIRSLDPYKDIENGTGDYNRITALRKEYPHLKAVSLAIGGWNEGGKNYSDLASSPERRGKFISSVVQFLKRYNFNGFDLDWEFPADPARGGIPEDKENFVLLVKELKEAFRGPGYILTAAINSNTILIDAGYDIPEMSKYLDHIYVMAYDYHGVWDTIVLPNAPLTSQKNVDVETTIKHLLAKGAPPSKLILGVPMYGRTFILTFMPGSPSESPMNKPCENVGFKGPYTRQDGYMGYNEICEEIMNNPNDWSVGWDQSSNTPYAVKGKQVIVYDDPTSIKNKSEFAMKMDLGGIMVWSIDTDDFQGKCRRWKEHPKPTNPTFPMMQAIHMALTNGSDTNNTDHTNDDTSSCDRCVLNFTLVLFALLARYLW
ncbi:putative chitinase 2 [Megalopta genalis]|uniref:putative chitinase 2 n=1 Tax=Megalopta genalis TaxID=115081 RepID=UPI003FD48750